MGVAGSWLSRRVIGVYIKWSEGVMWCHVLFFNSLFSSLSHTVLNLLGLNWRLKPAEGHLVSTGLSMSIPGIGDGATAPSGGRGKNACQNTGTRQHLTTGNPNVFVSLTLFCILSL